MYTRQRPVVNIYHFPVCEADILCAFSAACAISTTQASSTDVDKELCKLLIHLTPNVTVLLFVIHNFP